MIQNLVLGAPGPFAPLRAKTLLVEIPVSQEAKRAAIDSPQTSAQSKENINLSISIPVVFLSPRCLLICLLHQFDWRYEDGKFDCKFTVCLIFVRVHGCQMDHVSPDHVTWLGRTHCRPHVIPSVAPCLGWQQHTKAIYSLKSLRNYKLFWWTCKPRKKITGVIEKILGLIRPNSWVIMTQSR